MNICIPIKEDQGLRSKLFPHFGAAPRFLVVDTDAGRCHAVENTSRRRPHGRCWPMEVFAGAKVDAVVVRGIGAGALSKLQAAGIAVYQADQPIVEDAVVAAQAGALAPATPANEATRAPSATAGGRRPHRRRTIRASIE
jgi:predicted Fe-Mo cluster-binding NifX family protein